MDELRKEYESLGGGFPQDGDQAVSSMRCFNEFQQITSGVPDRVNTRKYVIARRVAIAHGVDVSGFPERINVEVVVSR